MNCAVGHRCGSHPALLSLWCRLAAAAPIRPLAWEIPHAAGAPPTKKKKKEEDEKTNHGMGEIICEQSNQQGINLQNIQRAHTAQYQKNNPIKKWAKT